MGDLIPSGGLRALPKPREEVRGQRGVCAGAGSVVSTVSLSTTESSGHWHRLEGGSYLNSH